MITYLYAVLTSHAVLALAQLKFKLLGSEDECRELSACNMRVRYSLMYSCRSTAGYVLHATCYKLCDT